MGGSNKDAAKKDFDPVRIAATGRKLQLMSDARYRMERGVDPEFVVPGLELATQLILEWCGGEPSDIVVAGAVPEWRREIEFPLSTVRRLGGLDVPEAKAVGILISLGFEVTGKGTVVKVTPPSWRSDVLREVAQGTLPARDVDPVRLVRFGRDPAIQ